MIPEPLLTAVRAATSLPNACDAIKTAAGDCAAIICARTSATAATPLLTKASDSTMTTLATGPLLISAAIAAPFPAGARTTAVTSPIRAPAVANSAFVFVALPLTKSAKINTLLISTSFLLGMKPFDQLNYHR